MHRFGISTHLFHEHRLSREHLVHIAAHGFEAAELFATRSHFDYRNEQSVAELTEWLSDTQLVLHSVHAPIVERMQKTPGDFLVNTGAGKRQWPRPRLPLR